MTYTVESERVVFLDDTVGIVPVGVDVGQGLEIHLDHPFPPVEVDRSLQFICDYNKRKKPRRWHHWDW